MGGLKDVDICFDNKRRARDRPKEGTRGCRWGDERAGEARGMRRTLLRFGRVFEKRALLSIECLQRDSTAIPDILFYKWLFLYDIVIPRSSSPGNFLRPKCSNGCISRHTRTLWGPEIASRMFCRRIFVSGHRRNRSEKDRI